MALSEGSLWWAGNSRARSEELFQFAFDRGVADVFILKDAVGVIVKVCGMAFTPKIFATGPVKAAIADIAPGHFVFADDVFPLLFIGIRGLTLRMTSRLPLKLFGDLRICGSAYAARYAPVSPKIEQHDLALQVVHGNPLSLVS